MSNPFFDHPILNSPYECPAQHWELDPDGQPTQKVLPRRRAAEFITPVPKPKKRKKSDAQAQAALDLDEGLDLSSRNQQYDVTSIINQVRQSVDTWRALPNPDQWQVTPETRRLLQHWRGHTFSSIRPFFCQVEAAETAIWLTEVAPQSKAGKHLLEYLAGANNDANPELMRLALKLATGAGKTTIMAMLIAWQTVNAVRRPGSKQFTRGFLIAAPGLTVKERLRVLQPNDPDSYYTDRELVPADMLEDLGKAKIVITNFHAFRLRERLEVSKGGRQLLKGRTGDDLQTKETEGQMIQRVMPDLMGMKNILVLNDEAHHCYREKPAGDNDFTDGQGNALTGSELTEAKARAKKDNEAARLWISGLEAVNRQVGVSRVVDLSATPFFLSGSGYIEGTLFPWTMSDFSLMDAIECGIVKLPRVPVAENIPGSEMPVYRDLWANIRKDMPKKGRGQGGELDPLKLPTRLQTALQALYGHYEKTHQRWQDAGISVPPCFIIVCQNTAISKLVYDFVSGFYRKDESGSETLENGRLPLFRNFDDTTGNALPRPNTLLIDSEQLEAGDALDDNFRHMAADEIDRFRREMVERSRDANAGANITDQALLREVMNTVGKAGQLGGGIRCVVSVSMLTEGWDANTVTHVLGIRAFGTQLLCEQVIGRALRRQSYELNEDGLFDVEYADVFGIPFNFTAKPVIAKPVPPRETVQVKAVRPEREALEIRFPRVEGYRVELPEERLAASFNDESVLTLSPALIGPTTTVNSGLIGKSEDFDVKHLGDVRPSTILFNLTQRLLYTKCESARSTRRRRPRRCGTWQGRSTALLSSCAGRGTSKHGNGCMIRFTSGNILEADVEALVNTVNCVGVMGRGIALQFKQAFPANFKAYEAACQRMSVEPGRMFVFDTGALTLPRYIINFPTKRHWRGKSRMEDIDAGLVALAGEIRSRGIRTIAVPPLGSGLGGLDWSAVRPRIEAALRDLPDVEVSVYEPGGAPPDIRPNRSTAVPKMTAGRAALVSLMSRYLGGLLDPTVSLLEVHKMMYFLQRAGEPLKLKFVQAPYGPYAENLRHVLRDIEGHLVSGYADGGDAPDKLLAIVPGATVEAEKYLADHHQTHARLERVAKLVDGFETAFGLELLATVHWVMAERHATDDLAIERETYAWNSRKRQFTPGQIALAAERLRREGWMADTDSTA